MEDVSNTGNALSSIAHASDHHEALNRRAGRPLDHSTTLKLLAEARGHVLKAQEEMNALREEVAELRNMERVLYTILWDTGTVCVPDDVVRAMPNNLSLEVYRRREPQTYYRVVQKEAR